MPTNNQQEKRFDYTSLKFLMRKRGVTQKMLADAIGMTESHLCQKFSCHYYFRQDDIAAICATLRIPAQQIPYYFFTQAFEFDSKSTGKE